MERRDFDPKECARTIALCQQLLRAGTGLILASFAAIVVLTTISTGPMVQKAGKILYYVIVLDAFASLGIWIYRTRLEKKMRESLS